MYGNGLTGRLSHMLANSQAPYIRTGPHGNTSTFGSWFYRETRMRTSVPSIEEHRQFQIYLKVFDRSYEVDFDSPIMG